VREGWNGYNVFHDTASRVAALDVGFLPSARASAAPPAKFVYLLGSDDYREEDIPQDAFVVYQVRTALWCTPLQFCWLVPDDNADGQLLHSMHVSSHTYSLPCPLNAISHCNARVAACSS